MITARQLKRLNSKPNPTVVLLGDSLSTYFAQALGRSDMLADNLRASIERQIGPVVFWDRGIGGMTIGGLMAPIPAASSVTWNVIPSKTWISYAQDLQPDLVVLAFGMNDSGTISHNRIQAVVDAMKGWAKVPDIVFATNLVPSLRDGPLQEGPSGQTGRHAAAGWIRSYAGFNGFGVLDFHRENCKARDGFDPCSSVLADGETVDAECVGAVNICAGTRPVRDFKARLKLDPTAWMTGDYLTVSLGSGASDYLHIAKVDATHLTFSLVGGSASDLVVYASQTVTVAVPSTTVNYHYTVEKMDDRVMVYRDLDNFGAYVEPIFSSKIIAQGAEFTPVVLSNGALKLVAVDFTYGDEKTNCPTISDSELWGPGDHGGTGWNHPSSRVASDIYRPVLERVTWGHKSEQRGTFNAGPGTPTFSVSFPRMEPDASYRVALEFVGDPGVRTWIAGKSTSGFSVGMAGSSAGPFVLNWEVVR